MVVRTAQYADIDAIYDTMPCMEKNYTSIIKAINMAMQTLLDAFVKVVVFTVLILLAMTMFIVCVCNAIYYAGSEYGNPVLALVWGGAAILAFIAMIISMIAAIHFTKKDYM